MPKPPVGHIGIINAHSRSGPYMLQFNFQTDFDKDGLKSGAKGVRQPVSLDSLHKYWVMDEASKESLQAYALKLEQRYDDLKASCR